MISQIISIFAIGMTFSNTAFASSITWGDTLTDPNGQPIEMNWVDAKAHCQTVGADWRLPTVYEYALLATSLGARPVKFPENTCDVSGHFQQELSRMGRLGYSPLYSAGFPTCIQFYFNSSGYRGRPSDGFIHSYWGNSASADDSYIGVFVDNGTFNLAKAIKKLRVRCVKD